MCACTEEEPSFLFRTLGKTYGLISKHEDTGRDSTDIEGCKCDSGRQALHILLTCGKITVAGMRASNWLEGAQSDGI
jgi:hypothetical protein